MENKINTTKENKELLLKDLCARLPYGVKCEVIRRRIDGEMVYIRNGSSALELTINNIKELVTDNLYEIKPYLFPLSSMTKKQKKYIRDNHTFGATHELFDWLDKNNYDYRGLIEKDLAIDATNLNIY